MIHCFLIKKRPLLNFVLISKSYIPTLDSTIGKIMIMLGGVHAAWYDHPVCIESFCGGNPILHKHLF